MSIVLLGSPGCWDDPEKYSEKRILCKNKDICLSHKNISMGEEQKGEPKEVREKAGRRTGFEMSFPCIPVPVPTALAILGQ